MRAADRREPRDGRLLRDDRRARVAANQDGAHPELLSGVDGALSAFQADIEAQGLADRVTPLMWTEFGRRVRENGSGGTDHGTAGSIWVLGAQVAGGPHREPSPAGDLDANGDLKFTTDFRSVSAAVLEQGLSVNPSEVLDGAYLRLPLFK